MRERKAEMERRCDAFLTLPGGIGTLEELFEIWTARSLGLHGKPVVVLDPDGCPRPAAGPGRGARPAGLRPCCRAGGGALDHGPSTTALDACAEGVPPGPALDDEELLESEP